MYKITFPRLILVLLVCLISTVVSSQNNTDYYKNRTIDGSFNDLSNEDEGKAVVPFLRKGGHTYADDGYSMPTGPNPRELSNLLCDQNEDKENKYGLSSLVFTFLQFIDHDITFSEGGGEFSPVFVPRGDQYFDPMNTGMVMIPFSRSRAWDGTGTSYDNPRQQANGLSAWIDAGNVYGNDEERAKWLRSGECGKLKVHKSANGDLLPCNTPTGDCNETPDGTAPHMDMDQDHNGDLRLVFVAGDVRANEQPGLTALHTLFVREHNRICDELIAKGKCDDEANYQYARKMVNGIIQSIFYNELAPILGLNLGSSSYRRNHSPEIFNSFATAAFRIGHTMVSETIPVIPEECGDIKEELTLAQAFFNPKYIQENGMDGILRGLSKQGQQAVDLQLVSSIRNFLFGAPGAGGLDLAALNIQRGRDHGLPDFNTLRQEFGLRKLKRFRQITSDKDLQEKLEIAYGDVDNIDPWIGMLAEDHASNSPFGSTIQRILSVQFKNIRRADRFYYTRDRFIARKDRNEISRTTLADIIRRNTEVDAMEDVFYKGSCKPVEEIVYCDVKAHNSRYEWIDRVSINDLEHESNDDGGYAHHTDTQFSLSEGRNSIELSSGSRYYPFRKLWRVWIDLDKDGHFEDDEMVLSKVARKDIKDNIRISPVSGVKETRMRVMMGLFQFRDACHNIQYGEIEDYTVTFDNDASLIQDIAKSRSNEIEFSEDLSAYPNPTSDIITFKGLNKSNEGKFAILNTLGQVIRSGDIVDVPEVLDVSQWTSGTYTVMINYNNGEVNSSRFVVKR